MTPDIAIRPLLPEDAAAAAALHAAMPQPWGEKDWTAFLSDPLVIRLGATEASVLVGEILLRVAADEAEVLTIVVARSARGRGVGGRLLRAGLAAAARRGGTAAFLEVAADNDAAIALYSAAGFVEIGRRRGYYRRPDGAMDALAMRKGLTLDDGTYAT